jgi:hypothetical protein
MVVRHSIDGDDVECYIGRHGTRRIAGAVLAAAVSPIMLKSAINPEALPNGRIVCTWFADDISIRDRRAATKLPWKRNEESNDI